MRVFWVGVVAVLVVAGPAAAQDMKPEIRAKLLGHRGGVSSLAFSHKGDYLATGAGDGVVRLWDAGSGLFVAKVDDQRHDSASINLVAFSADGKLLSAASKTMVGVWDISDPKKVALRFEDLYPPEPNKTGAVTGNGKRVYFTATDNTQFGLHSYTFPTRSTSTSDLLPRFVPWALAPIPDPESGLVAVYGLSVVGEKGEPAVALVGFGEPKIVGRGGVKNVLPDRPLTIGFSPDLKWLVACNGEDVMYWPVPGSQLVSGDPRAIPGVKAYVAAAGPGNRLAVASLPAEGEKATVTIYDIGGTEPKPLATYATGIKLISALAFSPDGMTLAVGDYFGGVVQLWALGGKK